MPARGMAPTAVADGRLPCTHPPWLLPQPGEELLLRCGHIDVKSGQWRLDTLPLDQATKYDIQNARLYY